MELQARQKSRSGEDLRLPDENEEIKTVRRRPATAGIRITRGHQVHPLSKEVSERPTLPFNEWVNSIGQPDRLNDNDVEGSSASHSSQPIAMRGRPFRRIVPLEEEDTPENSSVNADIFTKVTTNSHTDPATGDIVLGDDEGEDTTTGSTSHQLVSQSASLLAPPQLTGEQHAYIPYKVAKETIAKICDEMAKMKQRHIRIVDEIDATYNEIEVETQQQFNDFVLRLKGQYSRKFATFKQVVELYQKELQKNRSYWQCTVESLTAKNKELLEENRALYRQNKKGFELLEAEKEQVVVKLTEKVEREKKRRTDECQKAVAMIRSLQAQHAEELQQQRQSACEELEATKAQHHIVISEMTEKHLAEMVTAREIVTQRVMEHSQLQKSEPSRESKLTADKEVLMASIKSSLRLKQKELDSLQHQFQSVCHLIRNEPILQTALGGVVTTLQDQHEQLTQQKASLQQSFKDDFMASHDGKEPTDDDWNHITPEMKKDLTNINNDLAHCESQLSVIRRVGNITLVDAQPLITDDSVSGETASEEVTGGVTAEVASSSQPSLTEYKEVIVGLEKSNMELSTVNEQLTVKAVNLENEKTSLIEELQRLQVELQELRGGAMSAAGEDLQIQDGAGETVKTSKDAGKEELMDDKRGEESDEETEGEQEAEDISVQPLDESVTDKEQTTPTTAATVTTKRTSTGVPNVAKQESVKEKQSPDKRGGISSDVSSQEMKKLKEQLQQYKKQQQNDAAQIKSLKTELKTISKASTSAGGSAEDKKELKKKEKEIKELVKQFEITKKNLEKAQATLTTTEAEFKEMKKSHDKLKEESDRKQDEVSKLVVVAKQAVEAQERVEALTKELKAQSSELKTLTENYNSERMLRKKYYNMIEDMKGKIRVYCRVRPLSKSELGMGCLNITESPDEYSINVHSSRGLKEFQFDRIFLPDHGQGMVFEDTHNLVQSAVDGYNVCIFAYGQTGSGKTYTMIGGMEGKKVVLPGIAPRAFERIFQLIHENKKKFSFKVSSYMLELYNDRLLDLFNTDHKNTAKLDIKKDKKGLVYIQGSVVRDASSADELYSHFEFGSQNRHTASTKMNMESSRSHLIIGIVIESTNLTTGAVIKGKLSLVDLAGSERAAKTEASAEQLKEAQSINKSLSALGDVISALSSGQDFVPYRNNKLTLLMQDSLGGNAKTLMFVNISPADYNMDETVISLTYASRVKLITNDAQKNAENKEIAKLKSIIAKLRRGEEVEDED